MNSEGDGPGSILQKLELLVVKDGPFRFCLHAEQIFEINDSGSFSKGKGEKEASLCSLLELPHIEGGRRRLLRLKEGGRFSFFSIDSMDEIISVPISHIHALPLLIERGRKIDALWGCVLINDEVLSILDLQKI